ncbi:MAG: hypothetical protein WCF78_03260 [archaeon]
MQLTKNELSCFLEIFSNKLTPKELSSKFKKSKYQIYRYISNLQKFGLITKLEHRYLEPSKSIHAIKLGLLLQKHPEIIHILSDSGLDVLSKLLIPLTINQLSLETKLKSITIYKIINNAKQMSIVRKEEKKYLINKLIWKDLYEFLNEYNTFNQTIDSRVPVSSKIYYSDKNEVIFSTLKELPNYKKTSFSVFVNYGLDLGSNTYYYTTKQKNTQNIDEVVLDTLKVLEKDMDYHDLIYLSLLYLKYKPKLKSITHPILENIKLILTGLKIDNYPSLIEIKEKAEQYNIKID